MDYLRIQTKNGILYGGNQTLFSKEKIRQDGCGVIAAVDVTLVLKGHSLNITWEEYADYLESIEKYFLYFSKIGMNGMSLSLGINHLFRKENLPYRAHWKLLPMTSRSIEHFRSMIKQGIPVIFAAGPGFPNPFSREKVSLYQRRGNEEYYKIHATHRHFMVITDISDEDMLTVSSWGKKYFIPWEELLHYSKRKSMPLFTNYLSIYPIL